MVILQGRNKFPLQILYIHDLEPAQIDRVVVVEHRLVADETGRPAAWHSPSVVDKNEIQKMHHYKAFGACLSQFVERVFAGDGTVQRLRDAFRDMIADLSALPFHVAEMKGEFLKFVNIIYSNEVSFFIN